MPDTRTWLLWQLADSAFPTSGFAHSGGLEAAHQLGRIRGREALERFFVESLEQTGASVLPLVGAAWDAPERFPELDSFADATLPNHVANRASRAQGSALLSTVAAAFAQPSIIELRRTAREAGSPMHLAPSFGFVAHALAIDRDEALRLFLFITLRGLVSAAVRLGATGPLEAQAIQAGLATTAEELLQRNCHRAMDDVAQTSPLLDLFQARHDALYSRLFSS